MVVAKNDLAIGVRAGSNSKGKLFSRKKDTQDTEKPQQSTYAPEKPRTLVITEGPRSGTAMRLGAQAIVLGRAEDSTIVLDDDYASGRHARLFPQGSRWFVEDMGSTNGTLLNGLPLSKPTPVDLDTPIKIGQTSIELRK
ncbi:MAG: FHA domain-containing protein [Micrococcaceae bacterium]